MDSFPYNIIYPIPCFIIYIISRYIKYEFSRININNNTLYVKYCSYIRNIVIKILYVYNSCPFSLNEAKENLNGKTFLLSNGKYTRSFSPSYILMVLTTTSVWQSEECPIDTNTDYLLCNLACPKRCN